MAQKRMISNTVIDTDAFCDMPLSAQALYFHLNMKADDDGFIANAKRIQRTIGASEDDLRLLVLKRFLITFDDGVMVIKHWRMHNTIRKDRYTQTNYVEDLAMLKIKDNGAYTVDGCQVVASSVTERLPSGCQTVASDKNRLDKNRIDNIYIGQADFKNYMNEPVIEAEIVEQIPYKSIIEHLNKATGRAFKHSIAKTQTLIKARWSEGFREDDFIKVIDKKVKQWKRTDMEKYLRPETLFGTKFEGYLNEPDKQVSKKSNFEPRNNDYDDLQRQLLEASMR